jgi:hypothetical protein
MDLAILASKWILLVKAESGSVNTVRIDSYTLPDLFLGVRKDGMRCLILKLPVNYDADFKSSVKQNLSLELYREDGWVILTLLDDQYTDLFDDLIFSIYNKINTIQEAPVYVSEFLKTYYKWSEFFQENESDDLSEDAVRGLLGEFLILRDMLISAGSSQINEVLSSWNGPYDTGHDFIGEFCNVEVKTKLNTSATIKISSEYQLQAEQGKQLELMIVTIEPDPLSGVTLEETGIEIKEQVILKMGDYSIFLKAIAQKGLTLNILKKYNFLRFAPVSINSYSCNTEGFPRLVREKLPDSISTVTYKLNVQSLKPFLSSEKFF